MSSSYSLDQNELRNRNNRININTPEETIKDSSSNQENITARNDTSASGSNNQHDNRHNKESDFECNICLDQCSDPGISKITQVVTLCGHLFCWQCLHRWMTSNLPGIRRNLILKLPIHAQSVNLG